MGANLSTELLFIPTAFVLHIFYKSDTNGDIFGIQTFINGLFYISCAFAIKAFINM
jgi:hypothetical protein